MYSQCWIHGTIYNIGNLELKKTIIGIVCWDIILPMLEVSNWDLYLYPILCDNIPYCVYSYSNREIHYIGISVNQSIIQDWVSSHSKLNTLLESCILHYWNLN